VWYVIILPWRESWNVPIATVCTAIRVCLKKMSNVMRSRMCLYAQNVVRTQSRSLKLASMETLCRDLKKLWIGFWSSLLSTNSNSNIIAIREKRNNCRKFLPTRKSMRTIERDVLRSKISFVLLNVTLKRIFSKRTYQSIYKKIAQIWRSNVKVVENHLKETNSKSMRLKCVWWT
jgi:hypothetical protein